MSPDQIVELLKDLHYIACSLSLLTLLVSTVWFYAILKKIFPDRMP